MKPTQEQVIAWAREAGGWKQWEARVMTPQVLEHFAALAYEAGRKDENEACAKVCEVLSKDRGMIDDEILKKGVLAGASMCALVIRKRGAP